MTFKIDSTGFVELVPYRLIVIYFINILAPQKNVFFWKCKCKM